MAVKLFTTLALSLVVCCLCKRVDVLFISAVYVYSLKKTSPTFLTVLKNQLTDFDNFWFVSVNRIYGIDVSDVVSA